MRNILENTSEGRLRSGWRVSFFITGLIIIWIIAGLLRSFITGSGPAWITNSLAFLGTAALLTFWVHISGIAVDKRSLSSFGLHINKLWAKDLFAGMIIAGLVSILLYIIGLSLGWYEFIGFRISRNGIIYGLIGNTIMMASVAYYEELVFRGYLCLNLYEGIQKRDKNQMFPMLFSILLVSSFFGISHAINPNSSMLGVANIVFAGFMLSIPFFLTGNLGMVIGLHFSWNFIQGPILGLPVSGIIFNNSIMHTRFSDNHLFSGAKFGMEGGLIGTLGILIILFISWIYLRKRIAGFQVHPSISSQSTTITSRWGQNP